MVESSDKVGLKTANSWEKFFSRTGFRVLTYRNYDPRIRGDDLYLREKGIDAVICDLHNRYSWLIQFKSSVAAGAHWIQNQVEFLPNLPPNKRGIIPVAIGNPPEANRQNALQVLYKLETDFFWVEKPSCGTPSKEGNPSWHLVHDCSWKLIKMGAYLRPPFDWAETLVRKTFKM